MVVVIFNRIVQTSFKFLGVERSDGWIADTQHVSGDRLSVTWWPVLALGNAVSELVSCLALLGRYRSPTDFFLPTFLKDTKLELTANDQLLHLRTRWPRHKNI